VDLAAHQFLAAHGLKPVVYSFDSVLVRTYFSQEVDFAREKPIVAGEESGSSEQ
jgi:hypothetical protein